ncbi:glycoside hydrolase family 3 protein [Vagococcus acidifermentans]|uniref:Fibronectin type III-like domain-containing protein n=1 Tax=Vagococcus acidifermentans TaxID=564710 RepID=A0A430B2F7_9ENTE|nr:glycoside hydrolase family 3 N-terminal domain-containing protein [Vagococcus acidifermentans]RSU14488.1 hypothetical protein CBF27_00440 [Vagococcus acidifermentans]
MDHRKIASKLTEQLTLEEKITLMSTHQSAIERLGIPEYHIGGEAAHGVVDRNNIKTSSFPLPIGLSQTWNTTLLMEVGQIIGVESRILYNLSGKKSWLTPWAPTIDMARDPRWGRNEESYGEDPYLAGTLSSGFITGLQGQDEQFVQVAAAPKHFYGNNNEYLRENSSNSIDERSKFEYFLKAFEPAFREAKAQSMMTAYNGINGYAGMQNPDVKKIVKKKWGMDGFVVSDGGALSLNIEEYGYHKDYASAVSDSLKQGIDCFVDDKNLVEAAVKTALEKGLITENDLDSAVTNILTVRSRLGHFVEETVYDHYPFELLGSDAHHTVVKKVTDESVVLLKNEDVLPLGKQQITVVGMLGNAQLRDWYGGIPSKQHTLVSRLKESGNLSEYIEGHQQLILTNGIQHIVVRDGKVTTTAKEEEATKWLAEDWGQQAYLLRDPETKCYLISNDDGQLTLNKREVYDWFIKERFNITRNQLTDWQGRELVISNNCLLWCGKKGADDLVTVKWQEDLELAKVRGIDKGSRVVMMMGNHPMLNGRECEDRTSMQFPKRQLELLTNLVAHQHEVIIVLVSSYPYEMPDVVLKAAAIVYANHGSQALGDTLQDILYGKINPSGRLSQTWVNDSTLLPDIRQYDIRKYPRTYHYLSENVLYPFGYGLSYGDAIYTDMIVDSDVWEEHEEYHVRVNISNPTGKSIKETVQCYASFEKNSKLELPKKKLVGFVKEELQPYSEKEIVIPIHTDLLTYWDVVYQDYRLPATTVKLSIGKNSQDGLLWKKIRLSGKNRISREISEEMSLLKHDEYYQGIYEQENGQDGMLMEKNSWIIFFDAFCYEDISLRIRYKTFADTFCSVSIGEFQQKVPLLKHNDEAIVVIPKQQIPKDLKIEVTGSVFIYG